jgi:hypothetical protein
MVGVNLLLNTQTTRSKDNHEVGGGSGQKRVNEGCGFFDKGHPGQSSRGVLKII